MKTLKKTLCLVLAVVMAVGVLILPANADMETYEGFQDTDEVNPDYLEAVATLTGMGIISGKSDTAFVPTASVTRAEAASLIVATLTTPAGRALAVLGSTHPFTDVGAAHSWAAGNIGYAYEAGIVTGKTDTTFVPDATVTGYELLTMLMKATGYEPKNATASWTAKAVEFAREYDIFETGLEDVIENPNKALTREETAQMIWQAVNHGTEGSEYQYVVKVPGATPETVYFDTLTEAYLYITGYNSALKDDEKTAKAATFVGTRANNEGSIASELYNLDSAPKVDDYGRPSTMWYNTEDTDEVYSFLTPDYDLEYNNKAVTVNQVLKDLGYKKTDEVNVTYVTDGVGGTPLTGVKIDDANIKNEKLGSGKGVLFEVYNNKSTKTVKIVIVNTYVHVLADGDIDTTKGEITIDGLVFKGVAGFAKDQVVIYTKNATQIVTLTVANTFPGKVTATNAGQGYIKVDGNTQYVSTMAKGVTTAATGAALINTNAGYSYNSANTYNYFQDYYGNIIFASLEAAAPAAKTDRIFIYRGVSKQYGAAGTDELTGNAEAANTAYARAYAIDLKTNTKLTINIAITADPSGKYHYVTPEGGMGVELGTESDPFKSDDGFGVVTEQVFEFVLRDDGTYAIRTTPVTGVSVALQKNKADAITYNGSTYYANKDTVVKLIQYSEETTTVGTNVAKSIKKIEKVVTYNGYDKLPETQKTWSTVAGTTQVIYEATTAGVLTSVTVVTTDAVSSESTTTPVNYAVFAGLGETTDKQEYIFYVNGESKTYVAAPNAFTFVSTDVGKVFDITVDGTTLKGIGTGAKTADKIGEVEIITDDYFVLKTAAGSVVVTFADNCVVVDGEASYAVTTLTVGDKVDVYGATAAGFVVVTKNK